MLELRPMTEAEYLAYREFAVEGYALEIAKSSGHSLAAAQAKAEEQFQYLLPQGWATPEQEFYVLIANAQQIGTLWINTRGEGEQRHSFIYDFLIDDAFQGKGYGTAALERLKAVTEAAGAHSIRLHVFGHNKRAIHLYEKMGFVATNINMQLDLAPKDPTSVGEQTKNSVLALP